MQYARALEYLFSFLNFERISFCYRRQFNLKRMGFLLDWFGHPERLFPSILVAGTKGKGSTANFLSSILNANRYSTGLYTSPHLSDPRERIRVDGRAISQSDFAKLVAKVRPIIRRRKKEAAAYAPITFFEIFTLLAILYFAEKGVDLGVFEVGMGGRLDATNVLDPWISIVTPISFDHEEHLGRTLSSIAREKAAIIKARGCVVSGNQGREAGNVIRKRIRRQKAKGYFFGRNFRTRHEVISKTGGRFDFQMGFGQMRNLRISLPGRFQIRNAAVALAAASILQENYHFHFTPANIRKGLRTTVWPGRFEILKRGRKTYILDSAHNGASMSEICATMNTLFPGVRKIVILGTSREKNLKRILAPLLPNAAYLIVTKSNNPRAQEPKVILETLDQMRYKKPTFWSPHLEGALQIAGKLDLKDAILLITGSLFLVAEARKVFRCPKFI